MRDNGTGIEPQLLPHVFDLFVQGERSLDRSQGGLGIGLTLVRHLVELHQGRVEAYSDGPGQGREVQGDSCRASAPWRGGCAAGRRAAAPRRRRSGRRVLVVDDNVDAAESIAMLLRLDGPRGEGGRRTPGRRSPRPRVFAPQVVVLDIGLPGTERLRDRAAAARSRGRAAT